MSRKIFLNDNIIWHVRQRGVTRYFHQITNGVIAHFGSQTIICSPQVRDYRPAKYIRSVRFRGSWWLGVHDKIASIAAWHEQPAVFYSPYYGNATVPGAEVFTVHDMIYELFPQYFSVGNRAPRRFVAEKRRCLERAAALVAVSESTARDIVQVYPHIDATKITVAPEGVGDFFFEANDRIQQPADKPYFLFVGHRDLYKNFARLLVAFGQSGLSKEFDLRVISPIIGDFSQQEAEHIHKFQLHSAVQLLSAVDDIALRDSYRNAVAFVYPSEYEGFGLPILEAMASGTLVVTADCSSMPEVGGNAAFYFDPRNIDSITDCLYRVTALSSEERLHRIIEGRTHARQFTWARCQQQTVDVLSHFV